MSDPAANSRPRNVVFILLDSLNRHLIGPYGSTEFDTPNLDRLAKRATRFTNHFAGSLPCMPARHDLLCGNLDFPWRPWGSIEVWEEAITVPLEQAGVTTMLISDHPHLFETGGENYHCNFSAWDYQRGHEGDLWKTRPDPTWVGTPKFDRGHMPYDNSRGYFRGEPDFPGPRTMAAAAAWLDEHAPHHDGFMLFVDEFDPHEPFDTPEPYASMYDEDWDGPHLVWPPYTTGAKAFNILDDRQAHQVRAQYGGKLTMIDHWVGKILDVIDTHDMWSDAAVILTTDHGHYLGERDAWGKPRLPLFNVIGHIPLLIAWPGRAAGTCDAVTTSVDLHATLCDLFGATTKYRTHGKSLVPLLTGEATSVRESLLAGYWSREVHIIDSEYKYARAPIGEDAPLGMWSNRWSTMPIHMDGKQLNMLPPPDERATLERMPGTNVPVIHQLFQPGDMLPYWAFGACEGDHLYVRAEDPAEERNLAEREPGIRKRMTEQLHAALTEIEAPPELFARIGLA